MYVRLSNAYGDAFLICTGKPLAAPHIPGPIPAKSLSRIDPVYSPTSFTSTVFSSIGPSELYPWRRSAGSEALVSDPDVRRQAAMGTEGLTSTLTRPCYPYSPSPGPFADRSLSPIFFFLAYSIDSWTFVSYCGPRNRTPSSLPGRNRLLGQTHPSPLLPSLPLLTTPSYHPPFFSGIFSRLILFEMGFRFCAVSLSRICPSR